MPPKNKRSTATDAAAKTTTPAEPLRPGYTRHQGTRHVFDEKGERVNATAGSDTDHESESPS